MTDEIEIEAIVVPYTGLDPRSGPDQVADPPVARWLWIPNQITHAHAAVVR
jgi:hypothetical protein